MGRIRPVMMIAGLLLGFIMISIADGYAQRDGGYDVTADLWVKAVLQVSGNPVTLIWKEVGSDTTPSGDRVVSGYFYADPAAFAYGSVFNPEVFVKVYIATNGWANIAFNHVTVDDVTVSSAYRYAGTADKTESLDLTTRLQEHACVCQRRDNGDRLQLRSESGTPSPGAAAPPTATATTRASGTSATGSGWSPFQVSEPGRQRRRGDPVTRREAAEPARSRRGRLDGAVRMKSTEP